MQPRRLSLSSERMSGGQNACATGRHLPGSLRPSLSVIRAWEVRAALVVAPSAPFYRLKPNVLVAVIGTLPVGVKVPLEVSLMRLEL